jgi:hypothetical protein
MADERPPEPGTTEPLGEDGADEQDERRHEERPFGGLGRTSTATNGTGAVSRRRPTAGVGDHPPSPAR